MMDLLLLSLVLGATSEITVLFLHTSTPSPSDIPPMIDLATPHFSPVYTVLQYLSAVLLGIPNRMLVLLSAPGQSSTTLQHWFQSNPLAGGVLRRLSRTASAWVFYRHERIYNGWPWKLAAVGDPRLTNEDAYTILQQLFDTPLCCLDQPFSAKLRSTQKMNTVMDNLRTWRRLLWRWASQISPSICDVECRHARTQRHSDRCSEISAVVARSVLDELKMHSSHAISDLHDVIHAGKPGKLMPSKTKSSVSRQALRDAQWNLDAHERMMATTKAKSALQLYQHSKFAEERVAKSRRPMIDTRREAKLEWEKMPSEDKLVFEMRAHDLKINHTFS